MLYSIYYKVLLDNELLNNMFCSTFKLFSNALLTLLNLRHTHTRLYKLVLSL